MDKDFKEKDLILDFTSKLDNLTSIIKSLEVLFDNNRSVVNEVIRKLLSDSKVKENFEPLLCSNTFWEQINNNENLKKIFEPYINTIKEVFPGKQCVSQKSYESLSSKIAMEKSLNYLEKLNHLGLKKEDAKKVLANHLGKDLHVKDLIDDRLKEDLIEKYAKELVNGINMSCQTSYCIAMKMSTLLSKLKDSSDLLNWNPYKVFRKILFSPLVLNNAVSWALDDLSEEIDKPHFKSLWVIKPVILE